MMDDLINEPVFFISEELEKERVRYYNRLNGVRGDNPDWYSWIDFFLSASQRMADHLLQKLENIDQLAKDGLNIINDSHAAINQIWLYTFSKPYCITNDVADAMDITSQTARKHLNTLTEKKLLEADQSKKRNRLYVNDDLIALLN